ncbi:HEPN domain-containing protein [Mycolicibacterium wolinskyi]|uniref:HEPN domain-containing protein n=1 Tax=Mycolicibacterium wolinskyi TaxID=59750 RepID=UPI0039177D32
MTLDAGLVDDPRIRRFPGGVGISGRAEDSVASFLPITLHGELDTGERITMLNARNHGGAGQWFRGSPRYVADTVVLGEHIDTDQPVNAVRFRLGHRYWFDHLNAGDVVVDEHGAVLGIEDAENGNWLTYTPASPQTLRRLEVLVVSGVRALMQLALDQPLAAEDVEIRVALDGPWLPLLSDVADTCVAQTSLNSLLPREVLTLEMVANWIPLNDRLDGLAAAVFSPMKGALQAEALVVTSLVEGIHRRLPYQQSKFPGISKKARRAIVEAGRLAGRAEATAYGLDSEVVGDSLQFLTDVSFRMRATEIVSEVCSVIPEITESLVDLPGQITKARNDFAHHLPIDEAKEPLEKSYLRWLIVVTATPWLLRALLLLHAGVQPDVIREGFLESNRFDHVRANIAQLVRELGWEYPSPPAEVRPLEQDSGRSTGTNGKTS